MDQLALINDLPDHVTDRTAAKKAVQDLRMRERGTIIAPNYHLVRTNEQLTEIADAMRQSEYCAVDVETRGKRWQRGGRVVALNIYTASNKTAYFVPVRMVHAMRNFEDNEIVEYLGEPLADAGVLKIGQNFKFDMHWIRETFDIEVQGLYHDTLVAGMILNENESHDLEAMAQRYLKVPAWKVSHAAPFETWPMNVAQQYGCRDAEATYRMFLFQERHLEKRPKLHRLFYDIEMPTIYEAYEMERRGVSYDIEYHNTVMKPEIEANVQTAAQKIYELAGREINLNSDDQVATLLFEYLGYPRINGNHADAAVLSDLKKAGCVGAGYVLEWRQWATIDKMFVRKLPTHVVHGKIHCTFNTSSSGKHSETKAGTNTGRLTCKDPNLQQLPKRVGPIIRRAIVPSPGCLLASMDFNQMELRMLAHLSNDEGLIQAFHSGKDIHTAVMCNMLDVSYEEYEHNPEKPEFVAKRVLAKTVNFGVLYGMGPTKLAWKTSITLDEAKTFIAQYFDTYPGIKKFINRMKVECYNNGYVETIYGRKRRLPDIRSTDHGRAAMAEREAVNSPIQGSVADLAKHTMLKQKEYIISNNLPYELLLQIHDEMIYDIDEQWLRKHYDTLLELKHIMETICPLRVPIVVSLDTLTRWGDKVIVDTIDDFEEIGA